MDAMVVGGLDTCNLIFDHLDNQPQHPEDDNEVAAWYDTLL
jgi:hypothetical protein